MRGTGPGARDGAAAPRGGGAAPEAPDRRRAGFGLAEAMVALVIFSVGLLALAAVTLSVSAETRAGVDTTARVLAGQQVLEAMVQEGYAAIPTGDTTVRVGGRSFTVHRTIPATGPRWKELRVEIEGSEERPGATLTTRLHAPRPLPGAAP